MSVVERSIGVIGNGTTAVNFLRELVKQYKASSACLSPIAITIFGDGPEKECGRGFAYRTGIFGNLTEGPDHADYGSTKGAFQDYARTLLRTDAANEMIASTPRHLVGAFHVQSYEQLKTQAAELGIHITYKEGRIVNIKRDNETETYYVHSKDSKVDGSFDRLVLALGDILSDKFDSVSRDFSNQVFRTPYDAIGKIKGDGCVVALGTRSSFVDLVRGLFQTGFQGKIIGVSSSGIVSSQGAGDEPYQPFLYLNETKNFSTTQQVLSALHHELINARAEGAWVPETLINALNQQALNTQPARLIWDFNFDEEAHFADKRNYHSLVRSIYWERVYHGLSDENERKSFKTILSDFILYHRVNVIVPSDYQEFVEHVQRGGAVLQKGHFDAKNISRGDNNKLRIQVNHGVTLSADYIVNCAIGPVTSRDQVRTHELLGSLHSQGVLIPCDGTGFFVANGHKIDLLGSQARPLPFTSIGLETYGRQVTALASHLIQEFAAEKPTHASLTYQRNPQNG